jgi:Lrp/AsnC family leucine-responsive transcriptional regulator
MRFRLDGSPIDPIDHDILTLLQQNCRVSLASIGERVGLSSPSVLDRIKKLEASGVVRGYEAVLDARRLGFDITAFIGVTITHPNFIESFLDQVAVFPAVQESHQVTGQYTVLLKVKSESTHTLGELIGRINRIEGVTRSVTTVALSTHTERATIEVPRGAGAIDARSRRARRGPGAGVAEPDEVGEELPGKD